VDVPYAFSTGAAEAEKDFFGKDEDVAFPVLRGWVCP